MPFKKGEDKKSYQKGYMREYMRKRRSVKTHVKTLQSDVLRPVENPVKSEEIPFYNPRKHGAGDTVKYPRRYGKGFDIVTIPAVDADGGIIYE